MPSIKAIKVFGAGISGLVAAINLANSGFEVEIREKRDRVGGDPEWHPSVHQQCFDVDKTSQYIGIDLTGCFKPVKRHNIFFYDKIKSIEMPDQSYICEKGPQSSSIDQILYLQAEKAGVKFIFGEPLNLGDLCGPKTKNTSYIVATGLEKQPYLDLNIKHRVIQGYRASGPGRGDAYIDSYMGDCSNHEFAYVASSGNIVFALLFSRKGMHESSLPAFRDYLQLNREISFNNWKYSQGCIPAETNLMKSGVVLAGTISGMIDPFYLNGISAALISGKIAALYFTDREKAYREFGVFTKNFSLKQFLQSISYYLPAKKYSFPLISLINNQFKWVGVI
jgi:flavin-dependent dehydrogenase